MNKTEAISLVQGAFDADYSDEYFVRFVSNLFKGEYTPLDKRRDGHYVREAFRAFVQGYRILGTYQDAEGTSLDILEVTLQREGSLERARTAQRNFIADYLKKNGRDAALVAFLSPGQHDWRFSLVKLEYSLEVKDGKLKTEEELTPAKRWSFLIGRHEGSHTVQSRFVSLLQDAEKPLLKELEEAFNIESVTDEFFKKYCELFFRMKESLDKLVEGDPAIKADFDSKELTTVDFAKKTLGQMAFLYFLQKKGWFGVAPGKPWGTGPKDFLRQLFGRREKYGKNFFDDVLEPLFYEALAQDRGVEAIYPRLNNCRMPFLNGGLFEPMNGYSWETTNIRLPVELFSNSNRTAEGDEGDGILDIFDRYNFTVNENEPLEKEVAVDPEMLGKVFENLLEVKDRKSKGTFYTPREIVHYMCQESLTNYLYHSLQKQISRSDLEVLIFRGSRVIEVDTIVIERGRETDTYKFMLPESIRARAQLVDKALADVKVCDPAVGSGAFPLGMLNEIVQAREVLGVHLGRERNPYELKLHSISHSIHGVDIDPGAVEIAKLRLWLALVVDENEPHPLPNLDHKIMQGNSLLEDYEGIELFDESILSKTDAKGAEQLAFGFDKKLIQVKMDELNQCIEEFITEAQRSKKQSLKARIDNLKWELIEATLLENRMNGKLEEVARLRKHNIRPYFVWKLEFSEVFQDKEGFDIVIANPPYLESRSKEFSDKDKVQYQAHLKKVWGASSSLIPRGSDLMMYFYPKALEILNANGSACFITENSWLDTDYGDKCQEFLLKRSNFRAVVDSKYKYFSGDGGPNINTVISMFSRPDTKSVGGLRLIHVDDNIANIGHTLSSLQSSDDPRIDLRYYAKDDKTILLNKWGFLYRLPIWMPDVILKIQSQARKEQGTLNFGQGLNITADHAIPKKDLPTLGLDEEWCVPFFRKKNSFVITETEDVLVDLKYLSASARKLLETKGYKGIDFTTTRKVPAKFVLPRGIGRHFCAMNECSTYTHSYVEIYPQGLTQEEELAVWAYCNSSLFWFLRELSGRTNLGGGMLKSEATDVSRLPFPYKTIAPFSADILKAKTMLESRSPHGTLIEASTTEHSLIDEIVLKALGLSDLSKNIRGGLISSIRYREEKSRS